MRLACLIVSAALHLLLAFALWRGLPAAPADLLPPKSVAVRPVAAPPPLTAPPAIPPAEDQPQEAASARTALVHEISPVKRDQAEPAGIWIGRGELKQGAELALSMRALTGFNFEPEEFCGYYLINGTTNRVLSIIDGRKTYGKLLIHDSATGMLRTLTRYARFIYTYAATFDGTAPVEGSVTFLARKDFERTPHVDDRSRIIWLAKDPPGMIGSKFDFLQERLRWHGPEGEGSATLIALKDGGPYPAVAFYGGDDCRDREMYLGLARLLAVDGVAVAVVDPPGCLADEPEPATRAGPSTDIVRTIAALRRHRKVAAARTGIFGYGPGAAAAARAASAAHPAFLVLALDAGEAGAGPEPGLFGHAAGPKLCILTSAGAHGTWPVTPAGLGMQVVRRNVPSGEGSLAGSQGRMTDLFQVYLDTVPAFIAGLPRSGPKPQAGLPGG